MKSSISSILILLSLYLVLDACKITVKLRSRTRNKFQIQIFVPALKQKTERVTFEKPGEKKVEGENCNKEHWLIRTWKLDNDGKWVHALPQDKELKVKIEGNGWLRVMIDDDLKPWLNDRMGVFCSEGFCG